MTWKQIDQRFSEWFFKPLAMIAPYLRTNYWLVGPGILIKPPFKKAFMVRFDELDEIGVETTDQGPFIEDVFWILKGRDIRLRIGEPHPIFTKLMDRFGTLDRFDWQQVGDAMSCSENRYFVCWKRQHEGAVR